MLRTGSFIFHLQASGGRWLCGFTGFVQRNKVEQQGFSSNLPISVASSAPFRQPINTLNSHRRVKRSLCLKKKGGGGQSNRTHNTTTPLAPSLSSQCFITQLLLEFRSPEAEIKENPSYQQGDGNVYVRNVKSV